MPRGVYARSPEKAAKEPKAPKAAKTQKTAKAPKESKALKTAKVAKAPKVAKRAKREELATVNSSDNYADILKLNTFTSTLAALNGSSASGVGNTAKMLFAKIEAVVERIEPTPVKDALESAEEAPKTKRAAKDLSVAAPAVFVAPTNGQAAFMPPAAPTA